MYFVPDGTKLCGFYECVDCNMRFLDVRIAPTIVCPYCGEEMREDKITNAIISEYDLIFSDALMYWAENPKKPFLSCWTDVIINGDYFAKYLISSKKEKRIKSHKNRETSPYFFVLYYFMPC